MGRIHKEYYSANARYLSDEAIQEIKESMGKVPDAVNVMASKYQINYYRVLDYMENRERKQQMIYPRSTRTRNAISPEIVSMPENKYLSNTAFHLESQHQNNISDGQIKKRRSKSKSVRVSDPPSDSKNLTEKIGGNSQSSVVSTTD
ncbi:7806_t:CDS:1, partial [Entrophospora sp. SA101]